MCAANPVCILWDASHIWGLMVWRALCALGLPCRLVKGQDIANGALFRKPCPQGTPGKERGTAPLLLVPGGGEFARLRRGALVGGQLMPAAVRPAPLQTAGPEGGVGLIPGKNHIARPSGKDGVHALVRLLPLEVRLGARGQGAEARAAHAGLARLAHHELRQPPGAGDETAILLSS